MSATWQGEGLFFRSDKPFLLVPGRPASARHGGANLARHHVKAEQKECPMRRLLDLLVWAAVIAATIGAITFGTPSPKPDSGPIPRYMSGPTAADIVRANGEDPALVIE
jgi:hypothetical protein